MDHRIICAIIGQPTEHRHIVGLGVRGPAEELTANWTIADVIAAMGSGDRFYTYVAGDAELVEDYVCRCGYRTVRSLPGCALAYSLDRVRECDAAACGRDG
jgi:hypothetical protein